MDLTQTLTLELNPKGKSDSTVCLAARGVTKQKIQGVIYFHVGKILSVELLSLCCSERPRFHGQLLRGIRSQHLCLSIRTPLA